MYINIKTNQLISREKLRVLYPTTSFPLKIDEKQLLKYDLAIFHEVSPPKYNPLVEEISKSEVPLIKDGEYYRQWKITKKDFSLETLKNIYIISAKKILNEVLKETDWYFSRFLELDEEVPPHILEKRSKERTQYKLYYNRVEECKSEEELKLISSFTFS